MGGYMKISKERLVVAKKANIEAVLKLGLLSLEHAERLLCGRFDQRQLGFGPEDGRSRYFHTM